MARFQDQIIDENQVPIVGATIWVFIVLDGGALGAQATLTDDTGATIIQPLVSDGNGIFYYNTTDGVYENQIHYGGQLRYVQQVLVGQAIGVWADGNKGDITVSGGGVDWQINPGAITAADLAPTALQWGSITGTLSAQADLQTALNAKANLAGGNNFTGNQSVTGNFTASGTLSGSNISPTASVSGTNTGDQYQSCLANTIIGNPHGNSLPAIVMTSTQATGILDSFAGNSKGLVPQSPGGATAYLRADGTWAVPPGNAPLPTAWGTITGTLSAQADLQTALNGKAGTAVFTSGAAGLTPASGGGTANFLRADGTWSPPPGGTGGAAIWGTITGTLSSQTDLQTALNAKANLAGGNTFTNSQIFNLTGGYQASFTGAPGAINFSGVGGDGITPDMNVRPNAGSKGVITFTENTVADRWSIGIKPGDTTLYFSSGDRVLGNVVASMNLNGAFSASSFLFGSDQDRWYQGSANVATLRVGTGGAQQFLNVAASAGGMFLNSGAALQLGVGSLQSIQLIGDGSVGIGTLTPNAGAGNLTVAGNAYAGGGGFIANGFFNVDSAQPFGFSHSRAGQAGYHLYNQGGAAEWVIYEPAHSTDDNLHIGQMAAGSITDRLTIDNAGTVTVPNALNIRGGLYVSTSGINLNTNGQPLNFTDTGNAHPYLECQTDNNFVFVSTDASGNPRPVWSILTRSSIAAFSFAVGVTISVNPPVNDNSQLVPTTSWVQANKAPVVQSVASAASVAPAFGNDMVTVTAQAAALTLANWTGTAIEGWGIAIRIKDNGTARAISFGTQYRAIGVTLPTTTVAGKTLYLGCIWNNVDGTVDVVSVCEQ
jgi:hypothetical protein